MTLAHYGKRRRGTAGITGRQRRVPEKPYWEEIKEDEDPKETVGGKAASPPSTPTRKSPKKRAQILETKSPSASTLSRRSRRRKRPRDETEEGTEASSSFLTKISNVGINFEISSTPSEPQSPAKNGTAKSMEAFRLKPRSAKNDGKQISQQEEIQSQARDKATQEPDKEVLKESSSQERENPISQVPQESAPIVYQELLGQLPKLESMLSGIHAALKLQGTSLQPPTQPESDGIPAITEATLEMHRAIEARQEESIRRLEALCEKQSKEFDELVKKTEVMQANHEKERDALSKEVETLRAVAKAFESQQSSNSVLLKKMEKLETRLSEKQEEQQNFSDQLLEMASNSKKQDIFLLERNVKIEELKEASSIAKSKYEGKIKELTIALRNSEAKVLEIETENQQFKNMLESFQASLNSGKKSEPSDSHALSRSQKASSQSHKAPSQSHKTSSEKQATSPSTPKSEATVTKSETRSAKKAICAVRPLSLEHANIIELPASPFDSMGRFKGSSPSRTRSSPSRSRSSPSRSRSKKTSSSSNSIGSSSTGRRRRHNKVPVPTFDSLSGINPGGDIVRVDST